MIVNFAPVIAAVQAGETEKLGTILQQNPALCEARDEHGVSALMLSLYYGRIDCAQLIVDHRERIDVFEAAALGQAGEIAKLLAEDPTLISQKSPDGFTPLHLAAFFGQEPAAFLLVNDGAELDARAANRTAVHPLHSAVAGQAVRVVQLLLEKGVDPNPRQTGGYTPLMGAAGAGMDELVSALLEHGANPALTSDDGKTAKDFALAKGHQELAELL